MTGTVCPWGFTPVAVLAYGSPVFSSTGSASSSVRSRTVGPLPLRRTPTTPVPDAGRHFIPEPAQLFRHSSGGALLLHRQLRVFVQVDVERVELGVDLIEAVQGRRGENEREEREHAPTYSASLIDTTSAGGETNRHAALRRAPPRRTAQGLYEQRGVRRRRRDPGRRSGRAHPRGQAAPWLEARPRREAVRRRQRLAARRARTARRGSAASRSGAGRNRGGRSRPRKGGRATSRGSRSRV